MKIEVVSGQVIHNGAICVIGNIIDGIDKENAERLCESGLCAIIPEKATEKPAKATKKK